MARLADTLQALAGEYLASGAVTAEVKTNLGPAVTVYSGAGGFSLTDALGIQAAIVIRKDGEPIATYGEPPATNVVLAVAYAAALVIVAAAVVKLIREV